MTHSHPVPLTPNATRKGIVAFFAFGALLVAPSASAGDGLSFSKVMETLKRCSAMEFRALPWSRNQPGLGRIDTSLAVVISNLQIQEIPAGRAQDRKYRVTGTLEDDLHCIERNRAPGEPRAFSEVWTLTDGRESPKARGFQLYGDGDLETPGAFSSGQLEVACIVPAEDLTRTIDAVPVSTLCRGQSAQARKQLEARIRELARRLRNPGRPAGSGPGL